MHHPDPKSSQNSQRRRRSITDSIRKVFRPRSDSRDEVTLRGRRISNPIPPPGGLPCLAFVKPTTKPPQDVHLSETPVSPRVDGVERQTTATAQTSLPPLTHAGVFQQLPEKACDLNPPNFPGQSNRRSPSPPIMRVPRRKPIPDIWKRTTRVGQEVTALGEPQGSPPLRRVRKQISSRLEGPIQANGCSIRQTETTTLLSNDGHGVLDNRFATKAQEATQRYVDALLREIPKVATPSALSSGAAGGRNQQLAFRRLLSRKLPQSIDRITKNWIDSAAVQGVLKLAASSDNKPAPPSTNLILCADKLGGLFQTFAVSDPLYPPNPVVLTTTDLKEGEGGAIPAVSFPAADQLPVIHTTHHPGRGLSSYHILLTTQLLSQETGLVRYLLTSRIDITQFVHSYVADLLLEANDDFMNIQGGELDAAAPVETTDPEESDGRYVEPNVASAPSLTEGKTPELLEFDRLEFSFQGQRERCDIPRIRKTSPPQNPPPSLSPLAVLEKLVRDIKTVSLEYFILSLADTQDYYEMSYISPAIFEEGEHVRGHLTHTAAEVMEDIGNALHR
jgi:hypothetical protein